MKDQKQPGVHDPQNLKDDQLKHGTGERECDREHQQHHTVMHLHKFKQINQ
jgi:hypothetical protein